MQLQKLAKDFLNFLDKISEEDFEKRIYCFEISKLPNHWFSSHERLKMIVEYALNKVRFNIVARERGWAVVSNYSVKNFHIKNGKIFANIIDNLGVKNG